MILALVFHIGPDGFSQTTHLIILLYCFWLQRVIDILKIDIEGDEWESLADMVQTGMFKNIKQLLVEFHFWKMNQETRARWLYVFRLLFKAGLRKFSRERLWKWMPEAQNAQYENTSEGDTVTLQVEMSFLNIYT